MMEDKSLKHNSFLNYLHFDYSEYKDTDKLQTKEEEGIKRVGELVKLVRADKALWTDEFGLTVPLTDDAKIAILARLKDHIDILQQDTQPFAKQEYWLGGYGHDVVFGCYDDILTRYYLQGEPKTRETPTKTTAKMSKQEQREQVLQHLIKDIGLDELSKHGQLGVWQKLTEIDSKLFPEQKSRRGTVGNFFGSQDHLKFK